MLHVSASLQVTVMSCQEARHFKRQVHGGLWRSESKGASNLFYDEWKLTRMASDGGWRIV